MRNTVVSSVALTSPASTLPVVGERTASRLAVLGIEQVQDLLCHWPRRWEDWRTVTPLGRVQRDQRVVVRGTLHDIRLERLPAGRHGRRGKRLVRVVATLRDEAGTELPVVWFNQAYLERILKPDRPILLAGPIAWDWHQHRLYLSNPQRDVTPGLYAIYPETEGVTSRFLRG